MNGFIVFVVDMYILYMNDYLLIYLYLLFIFNKKIFLFMEFCVMLYVNINYICNKYVIYYIYIYLEYLFCVGF